MSTDLKSPELYINRELSWLEFNDRVLRQGLCEDVPLLERLKFLAIVSSNLDEFFMIRVAGLMQQRAAGVRRADASGMTPDAQLAAISQRTHRMVAEQTAGIRDAIKALGSHGLRILDRSDWTSQQEKYLRGHFAREILPVLTPLAVEEMDPCPLLPGLRLHLGLVVAGDGGQGMGDAERAKGVKSGKAASAKRVKTPGSSSQTSTPNPKSQIPNPSSVRIAVVPIPSQLPRFIVVPTETDLCLARLEDVIAEGVRQLFPGCDVLSAAVFRITRDADVTIQDDDASDLLHVVEEAVLGRRRRAAVRLEISAGADSRIRQWVQTSHQLGEEDVYEIDGMLDTTALWSIANRPGFDAMKAPDWPPQQPQDLIGVEDLWGTLQERDVLLFHPYESFDPVVQMLQRAADDPEVLAIKQTLYRTSGDSPIIKALERAAENGKEVTALVELKARFDEARNITWARRLEDAGAHVLYGIVGYKTHAKALLIVRREATRVRRYVHLSTGNYNDRTARLYSDVGLMTSDRDIASDVAAFFNLLTGYSESIGWSKLTCEPRRLKERFIDLIDREAQVSTPDRPGLVMAKLNSLQDREIVRGLYKAAQAGVKIMLNVRGICCLRPGVPGVSENIEVCSIVDRYLEHARIFFFRNGGHEEVYLSSADWMHRNLDRRIEIIFPVTAAKLRRRLIEVLETCFADNVKARRLRPDGTYEKVPPGRPAIRAQEHFYHEAVEAVHAAERAALQFQPLAAPKE